MSERVLVVGATGGVGQLVVAKLLEKGFSVRALTRNSAKAQKMFGDRVETAVGDIRQAETLPAAMPDITHIICCTGTTAFPSARWEFDLPPQNQLQRLQAWGKIYFDANYRNAKAKNNPEKVDAEGVAHLVNAAPKNLQRFVFVSSCGVEHKDKPPYNLLNAYGVLDAKEKGEQAIARSGLPYTIIRPGRLIDGPYTSYDLNTLLKATTGGKQGVVLGTGDRLSGQTSRIDVAAACVECLSSAATVRKVFEIVNQGTRPPALSWTELFAQIA
ncbi:SDR family oxidoreductase [Trichocoleus sp. FACHB-262]|uniref:SDR family oxidoreductase n=1 Tax=Trichocoleus sp. FACHB-262 TaxID=2692869 RepID=UPI001687B6B3|nr:SDR family oxidoreductase [Trichocoleus sp. FACHB-262]MBD2122311.1 SDR family oxidoreductase [Trichocoleus sp. FACHB-262]